MKTYNMNQTQGTHTIEIKFQMDEYKGTARFKIGGNAKGIDVLPEDSADICNALEGAEFNDMKLAMDDEMFRIELKDDNGETMLYDGDIYELGNLVVGLNIVDYH